MGYRLSIFAFAAFLSGGAYAAPPAVFRSAVKDAAVAVEGGGSSGCGFVCDMDGKRYAVALRRSLEGAEQVTIRFADGKTFRPAAVEVADSHDVVRFEVPSNRPALKLCSASPAIRQRLLFFGNERFRSAEMRGTVVGVAAGRIELSLRFAAGDAGNAVLDEKGDVLGVAAFAEKKVDPENWIRRNGRREEVRNFALTLDGAVWRKTDLRSLRRKTAQKEKRARRAAGVLAQTRAIFKNPLMRVNRRLTGGDAEYFVNGNIILALSDTKGVKNPVVRVAVLLGCGSKRIVFDAVAIEPGGKFAYADVPVWSYGGDIATNGRTYPLGDGMAACCMEGLSYFQPVSDFGILPGKGRNIAYFDKSSFLSGGFSIPRGSVPAGMSPEIVAFRFECWQNGDLAGFYDSMRPDTLESRNIPADWFVIGRHPGKFQYLPQCRYVEK